MYTPSRRELGRLRFSGGDGWGWDGVVRDGGLTDGSLGRARDGVWGLVVGWVGWVEAGGGCWVGEGALGAGSQPRGRESTGTLPGARGMRQKAHLRQRRGNHQFPVATRPDANSVWRMSRGGRTRGELEVCVLLREG